MQKKLIPKIGLGIASLAIWIGAISSVNATITFDKPMWYSDTITPLQSSQNVVGTVAGMPNNSSVANEQTYAQNLLNMAVNQTSIDGKYRTTDRDYSGLLGPGTKVDGGITTVSQPWDYVLAKYDGTDGGYVLFALGGIDAVLPQKSLAFWSNDNGQGYDLSHYTGFNVVPEPTTFIAGALLLLPFGASVIRTLRKQS